MSTGLTSQGTTLADIRDEGDPNLPPVIESLPTPLFIEGTAGSYDMSQHVSDPDGNPLTLTLNGTLPQGLAWTAPNLTYDGLGPAALSAGHTLTADDGSLQTTSGEFSVEVRTAEAPGTFPLKRNISGGVQNSASNFLHDPAKQVYLFVRTVNSMLFQPRDLFQPTSRARWIEEFDHIHHINPLCLLMLHQAPMNNVPGYLTKASNKWGPYTLYAQSTDNIDRKDCMLSIDGTDNDLLQTNSQSSTTNKAKQAGWQYRVTNPQMRRYLSDVAIDCLCGTDLSGFGMGSGSTADYMIFWYDGIDINTPKSGASLRKVKVSGTVHSILENKTSKPKQPIQVRINEDPEFPTTGSLSQDSSYGATDDVHALWFYPPTGLRGFIGFHVIGYKSASGGKADLYLKELDDRYAHDDQIHEPEAGWKYCLNNQASGHSNADHNANGVNEDRYTVESFAHAAAVKEHFDEISAGTLAANGTNSMRSGNAFSSSNTVKRSNGLPHPSAYDSMWDIGHNESVHGNFKFKPDDDHTVGYYDCSNTNIARGMKAVHWSSNCIRPNQGGWMEDKPRGAMLEIDVTGHLDWSTLAEIDASFARFYWALQLMVPDCFLYIRQGDSTQFPCLLEEHFIDLDSNSSDPAPLGTYNPAGGGNGTHGHPKGSYKWATGGSGDLTDGDRHIYLRRIGDWLIAVNVARPNGYNEYAPTHLSGGFTAREPEDLITPTDFAQLVTDGVLDSGYTLTHYDPASYVNTNITSKLQALRPSVWDGFNWGPAQAHPDDNDNGLSNYTLSTVDWMLRDRIKNNGSVVDTSVDYTLGPLEAVVWKIS
jgi:hypothetical protein